MANRKPPAEPDNESDNKAGHQEVRRGRELPDRPHCILIIEDNPLNMKLFRDLLEAQGYQVLGATHGQTGLDLARAEVPDLILLDINLPDLSGLAVAAALKIDGRTRDIPILVVTASLLPDAEQAALASGCDAFMRKPIAISEFRASVESLLQDRRIRSRSAPSH